MKLLMITQKIDADDDILGVYHEWVREIAKSFDKLSVICLYRGRMDLSNNIHIFSLGKEKKQSRIFYLKNFFKYIWSLQGEYDAVFVHMNPIYIALGFIFWKVLRKKIFLWYAHPQRNLFVKFAYVLSDKVVTSVPEAFYAQNKKVIPIGQGIDTKRFARDIGIVREENSILSLGRISPAKRVDILLEAIKLLREGGVMVSVHIVGDASETYGGKEYYQHLRGFVKSSDLSDVVRFDSSVPNHKAPEVYNKYSIFVNLSPTGYFDKTVLEAMACECLVIASNKAYRSVFPSDLHDLLIAKQDDPKDLAGKIEKALALSSDERSIVGKRLRKIVEDKHSIFTLGRRLYSAFLNE